MEGNWQELKGGRRQCDQMARLFFVYLAIYNNKNLLYLVVNICKSRFKILSNTK